VLKARFHKKNDENFGGESAHIVVIQHITKEKIDKIIDALKGH
jgi:histidine decarboxylase